MFEITNKAAIVTGSGRGIGREIALALARQGANLVINDVNLDSAQQVVAEIRALERKAIAVKADVTQWAEVTAMVGRCVEEFGTVDICVNNAGIIQVGPMLEISEEDWDKVMAINLKGIFLCCKAVLPVMMKQRSGKIINIASIAGKRGGGLLGNSCYAASKGGVIAFTKTIAREGASYGINVNAITPGFTDTEMTSSVTGEKRERILSLIPLARAGKPSDVAGAACFLASSASDYVTGEIMDIDGGVMMD